MMHPEKRRQNREAVKRMDKIENVKHGLRHCSDLNRCNVDCPYSNIEGMDNCITQLASDALSVIEQMEQEIERLKGRETVEPKTGNWICGKYDDIFMCSSCERYSRDDYPYCHWCGAKMKQEGR